MTGASGILIKLGVRLVVFTAVFWFAAKKNDRIVFSKKWAPPLVALVFAVLNTLLYWALTPVLDIATLGAVAFAMPFLVNALLLGVTVRVFQSRDWFKIEGFFATLWMATFLTVAHGVLWFALDYLPKHV
jgi:uncharacterized membrane protein YvlD (DUF360 family)